MTDEPENLTLRLLREMREENRQMREEMKQGFAGLRQEIAGVRAEGKQQVAQVREKIGHGFPEVRVEFNPQIAEVSHEMRRGFIEVRADLKQQLAEARVEFRVVLETVADMAKVVNKTAEAVADLAGRVGRVEKRLDLPNGRALN